MKPHRYVLALLLLAATLPAHAVEENDRVRQLEQELRQLKSAVTEQEQRVKTLERQLGEIDLDKRIPAERSARQQTSPAQGD